MEGVLKKIEKFNLWNGNKINAGFHRRSYLDKISKYVGNSLIKVITGQRRTGKSYLLRQIMLYLTSELQVKPENIFYLNKEYLEFDEIKDYRDLAKLLTVYKANFQPRGKIYLFLDEIQNITGWEKFVNSTAQDFTEEYEIFISGSNSELLSGEMATLLSGRYIRFEVFPFGLNEFATYHQKPIGRVTFLEYLNSSGLPETFHLNETELKINYLKSLHDTIVLRDIIQRYKIKDTILLEEIFSYLTMNVGNITSAANIVKYFKSKNKKTNYETVSTYINYFLSTYVFHESRRYNIRGKQLLGSVRKYYLNDLAFKNYIYGIQPEDIGYNLENYVFIELKRKGFNVFTGIINNKEVDFIAVKNDRTVYIQVTYLLNNEKTINREYGNLLAINDNYEKYIVSLDEIKFSNKEGIIHLFPWDVNDL